MKTQNYDVVILGGGTSGVAAAIQAARAGLSILVLEESPWVGGMLTAAGVAAIDGNHQLPSGIWGEFRRRLREHYGGAEALASGWVSHTQFEPHLGHQILSEMLAEYPNIDVLTGYVLEKVSKDRRKINEILVTNGSRSVEFTASVFIDATEYGELIEKSGCRYRVGRDKRSVTGEVNAPETTDQYIQDMTWVAILKDYGEGADRKIQKPDNYQPELYRGCFENLGAGPDAVQKMLDYGRLPNNKFMLNWPNRGNDYFLNYLDMDRDKRQREFQLARNVTLGFVYFIQHELEFDHIGLAVDEFPSRDGLALMPYIRESRRVIGKTFLTQDDLVYPWTDKFKAGIAVGDYPLDHHHQRADRNIIEIFPEISAFTVPLGCLLPEDMDNLIVAEKNISVSHLANGCTRLQPVVMGIGQAAGATAAMAVKQSELPAQLAVRDIQEILLAQRAYIIPVHDITPEEDGFLAVQRIMASGVMRGESIHANWENRLHFNPDEPVPWKLLKEVFSKTGLPEVQGSGSSDVIVKNVDLYRCVDRNSHNYLPAINPESDQALTRLHLAVIIDSLADPFHKMI